MIWEEAILYDEKSVMWVCNSLGRLHLILGAVEENVDRREGEKKRGEERRGGREREK